MLPVSAVAGQRIQTIEALGTPDRPHALQQAWIAEQVPQCGYCTPAWLIHGAALLARNPQPSVVDISKINVVCRCGSQVAAQRAILRAAERMRENTR